MLLRSLAAVSFSLVATLAQAAAPTEAELAPLLARPLLEPGQPVADARAVVRGGVARLPEFATLPEWQTYAARLRQRVLDEVVFRDPTSRAWRDARTGIVWQEDLPGGDGYRLRKLRYEALPGLWIPAILYEPTGATGKIPVHLAVNGHDKEGKAVGYKQARCINLARRGIATLNVEWFHQGQLRTDGFMHYRMNQLDLVGVSGLAPFHLAMSRGLDLLLALPNADVKRVAVTGLSGGGWQTIMISALDPRVTLSNPVAGYSSFLTRAEYPSDLGDSEQTPSDLARVADYTHLTALLGDRAALLTYNAKDNCCFAAAHALPPLLAAAEPIFKLHGRAAHLRSHVNHVPGTHNFEQDNREALYRFLGDEFFPGQAGHAATELDATADLKTAAQLHVALPEDNLDFNRLALAAARGLPKAGLATPAKLAALLGYRADAVVAPAVPVERIGELQISTRVLRVGGEWSVPVVEIWTGRPTGTTLLVADTGRKTQAARVAELLAAGQRVLALDPFYFGESAIAPRDFLHALLLSSVGRRPLGIQAGQVAAVARWAAAQPDFGSVVVESRGPRSSVFALAAAVLEPKAIAGVRTVDPLASLHDVIRLSWSVDQKPELFCFGLLEAFDVPQLRALVGAGRMR